MHQRQPGFTLLELLVVVALIGLMITVVVANVGDGGREKRMENEARRLAAVARLASDEAVLMSQELSLVIEPTQYDFQVLGEKRWQPLEDERILTLHKLPQGMALELELESFTFTPKRKDAAGKDKAVKDDTKGVRIYFLSSGEVQPFTLYIKVPHEPDSPRFEVTANEKGEISWRGPLSELEK